MAYIQDGQVYESKADAPDLGSWVNKDGTYYGVSADWDKLPTG